MDFNKFNKNTFEKIEWNVKTDGFKFKKLGEFYTSGVKNIQIFGFFFVKSDNYGLQPVGITRECLVNLPTHHRDTISEILKDKEAVEAIKQGNLYLRIREYKSKYNKLCYDIDYCNAPEAPEQKGNETQADIF